MKKVYITTPIYYPNSTLHIGHAYSTVIADSYKRFRINTGDDVYFLTGSDEHGQKIEKQAQLLNLTPQQLVDKNVENFKILWKKLNINYDQFIRTTSQRHKDIVVKVYELLKNKELIYKDFYRGNYCIPCETYYQKKELINEKFCPICGKETQLLELESFFFKMSSFEDWITNVIKNNEIIILPENRKSELLNNFLGGQFTNLSITRNNYTWGINVESNHVLYVWIDALFNYISALGFLTNDDALYKKYWDNDDVERIHIIGKEITRFHCIYWPILLHSLELKLPSKIIAHGWITVNNEKMSKSLGNVVNPLELIDKYGADSLRYFLMKSNKIGNDFSFDIENFIFVINSDLANNVGNLVSRTFNMIQKYNSGMVPKFKNKEKLNDDIEFKINEAFNEFKNFNSNKAINIVQEICEFLNKLIENEKPWELFTRSDLEKLNWILTTLVVSINWIFHFLSAILTDGYLEYNKYIGWKNESLSNLINWNSLDEKEVKKPNPIFRRFEK
ncbi:methionine--tRNA ligase [Mycoplasma sp. (ex Biomphalaria glabrata)]|uniref:methionine--tRNA ligase n=1 Tax=Mycoplasma sp. (ex Biomphalaria glabrata) TaxID=1749074 RepID=UPI000A0FDF8B|nr:methionine--tRNA ligase [Mycoplasma sp. (ex Biomphalaria glabrata)]